MHRGHRLSIFCWASTANWRLASEPGGEEADKVIVDGDCHISSGHLDSVAIMADELIEQMGRAAVDRAVIWLKPRYDREVDAENEAVYAATRRYPDRLIGFGWANPRLGRAATLRAVRQCFEEYGLQGIKFNGAQDDYPIDDPDLAMPMIEAAARYGRPIAFHIGSDYYENTHPYRLGHIAAAFPDTQFLMVHMGGVSAPYLDRSAIEVAAQHPNVILIGSAIDDRAILRAIRALGPGRVCFGSDTPFHLMHVQLAMYHALLQPLDAQAQAQVLGENLVRLLNLEAP